MQDTSPAPKESTEDSNGKYVEPKLVGYVIFFTVFGTEPASSRLRVGENGHTTDLRHEFVR